MAVSNMKKVLKYLILILTFSRILSYLCPEADICQCQDGHLQCTCGAKENLTMQAVLNHKIKSVQINDCKIVTIQYGSISHLPLEKIELLNICELNIRPFSISAIESIKAIRFVNISDLKISSPNFVALPNLSSITMSNITMKTLPKGAFSLITEIEEFVISDSTFETVESFSLVFANLTTFKVTNSKFNFINNTAFFVRDAKQVIFSEATILKTSNSSFSIASTEILIFEKCSFRTLATSVLSAKNVTALYFRHCEIFELESDAFMLVNVTEKVEFSNNRISIANESSIIPNKQMSEALVSGIISIQVTNNTFTCDCGISWLWTNNQNGMYDSVINSSYCSNLENKMLSSRVPISDNQECTNLGEKGIDDKPLISEYLSSKGLKMAISTFQTILPLVILQILYSARL